MFQCMYSMPVAGFEQVLIKGLMLVCSHGMATSMRMCAMSFSKLVELAYLSKLSLIPPAASIAFFSQTAGHRSNNLKD